MKNNKIKIIALISSLMITSTLVSPIMSKSVVANEKLKESSETNKKNLSMLEATSNTIKLSWNTPSIGGKVDKYIIYKDGVKLDQVATNVNEYEVTNLEANTLYGFKIIAVGIDGQISRPVAKNIRTTK